MSVAVASKGRSAQSKMTHKTEVYLEPTRAFTMELFCENS